MDVSLQVAPAVAAPAAFWFLNSLVTIVADAALSGGSLAIYRQVAPPGFATPYHTHEAYGEGFYVLEGEVTLSVTERRASWAGMVFFSLERSHTDFA
jgi:quercetin dioxygenase-like cupin family protein